MSLSNHEEKMMNLQQQICDSQRDLQDYIKDLNSWHVDITEKDKNLKKKPVEEAKLPPVRNSVEKRRKRKAAKKTRDSTRTAEAKEDNVKRLSSYDYRAWDKFDVDKAIEKIDKSNVGDEEALSSLSSSASSSSEDDTEVQEEQRKQQAILEKEQGNSYFKEGKYDEAIESYSRAIQLDSANAILPANRAMALLKQHKYGAAETDCTAALSLDPVYIKAYLRRGAARKALKLWTESKQDFEHVLKLEPRNSSAQLEIAQVEKEIQKSQSGLMQSEEGIVKAIHKPAEERSKNPLRRIPIEEIGDEGSSVCSGSQGSASVQTEAVGRRETSQSQSLLTDEHNKFSKLLIDSPTQDATCQRVTTSAHSETETGNDTARTDLRFNSVDQQTDSASCLITELTSSEHHSLMSTRVPDSDLANGISNASMTLCAPERPMVHTGTSKESASSATSPQIPPCPQSSFQFQADCKHLKNNLQAFYHYFKQIDPSLYRNLFGEALDTDILLLIATVLRDFYIPFALDAYTPLLCLSSVKRFNMTAMLLSSREKQVVKAVLTHMQQEPGMKADDILTLADKYQVQL